MSKLERYVHFPLWSFQLLEEYGNFLPACTNLIALCSTLHLSGINYATEEVIYLTSEPEKLVYAFLTCLKDVVGYEELVVDHWIITEYSHSEIQVQTRNGTIVKSRKVWMLVSCHEGPLFTTVVIGHFGPLVIFEGIEVDLAFLPPLVKEGFLWYLKPNYFQQREEARFRSEIEQLADREEVVDDTLGYYDEW